MNYYITLLCSVMKIYLPYCKASCSFRSLLDLFFVMFPVLLSVENFDLKKIYYILKFWRRICEGHTSRNLFFAKVLDKKPAILLYYYTDIGAEKNKVKT